MHTAPIEQIRADARFERMVTTSSDKTLRIWRLADLQPLRTLHMPSEPGFEGTPYTVAISANGQRVFVAGYTGWTWRGGSHVLVADVERGRLMGSLGRFDGEVVTALDASPDDQRLAVGLGSAGLAVIRLSDGSKVFEDRSYAGPVSFVHHAPDGRLATASADGCLRVYAPDGRLLYRNQFPPLPASQPQCTGVELGGVRFSPDGRWLALGVRDRPEVGLFDARTLALVRTIRVGDAQQKSLCCIAWSPEGGVLFVNGNVESERPTPLYRLRDPAAGEPERWEVGRQTFSNMLPMPDGSIVFATTAPSLTRVGADGRVMRRGGGAGEALSVAPDNIDFHRTRNDPQRFLVSRDGAAVSFEAQAGRWLRAAPLLSDPSAVLSSEGTKDADLSPARRAGAVRVQTATGPYAHREPTLVDGKPVALSFQEGVRSWAVHATRPMAALATQWRVHLIGADGRPMPGWQEPPFLPAPAWHTVISEDGRWVVVAVGDGTIRWFEVATGAERLGLFVHADLADWVAWRPDGYYASSPQGDRYVGWLVNRGEAASPDFFRALQFERTLYRPDLLQAAFVGEATRGPGGAAEALSLSAPRVHIEQITAATREVRFTVEVPSGAAKVTEVGVYADGMPVLATAARSVAGIGDTTGRFTRTVRIPDSLSLDSVRVEAESSDLVFGLDEAGAVQRLAATQRQRGRLWLLALGVDHFRDFAGCGTSKPCRVKLADLPNAPNDALQLASLLKQQKGRLFAEADVTVLADARGAPGASGVAPPTKQSVMAALKRLEAAGPDDTVAVFMASHGIAGGRGSAEYYFLPSDAQVSSVEWALATAAGHTAPRGADARSLLSGSELTETLRRVAGRRLLIIDTCHAGAAGETSADPHSLAKRSASAQIAVLAASNGAQRSYESAEPGVKHGAFTSALLRGLSGAADRDRDGRVTLDELLAYTVPDVTRNAERLNAAERRRNPKHRDFAQTPVLVSNASLRASELAAVSSTASARTP